MRDQDSCDPAARRLEGDTGSNLVEYALLMALIVVVCLGAITMFGKHATGKMSCVSSAITQEVSGVAC